MKNAFYFTLKTLFVLKIFKFLSWLFGHVEKTGRLERQDQFQNKLIGFNMRNIFVEKS